MKNSSLLVFGLLSIIGVDAIAAGYDGTAAVAAEAVEQAAPMHDAAVAKTRAEVKEDLRRAIAAHEVNFSDAFYPDRGIVTVPRARRKSAPVIAATPRATVSSATN